MSRISISSRALLAGLSLVTLTGLSGCGALVVGGAATTAMVVADRRTAGEQVEDKAIEVKIGGDVRRTFSDTQSVRVNSHSYAGQVLLLGDVPTEQDKQRIGQIAGEVDKVKRVINDLRVGPVTPTSVRTNDTWITSKVSTSLINTKDVPSRTIDVTTERGIVYLQGRVTEDEGTRAAIAASGVSGVNKVVKLFDIVSPESVNASASTQPAPIEQGAASSPATSTDTTDASSGVQAMPVQ